MDYAKCECCGEAKGLRKVNDMLLCRLCHNDYKTFQSETEPRNTRNGQVSETNE